MADKNTQAQFQIVLNNGERVWTSAADFMADPIGYAEDNPGAKLRMVGRKDGKEYFIPLNQYESARKDLRGYTWQKPVQGGSVQSKPATAPTGRHNDWSQYAAQPTSKTGTEANNNAPQMIRRPEADYLGTTYAEREEAGYNDQTEAVNNWKNRTQQVTKQLANHRTDRALPVTPEGELDTDYTAPEYLLRSNAEAEEAASQEAERFTDSLDAGGLVSEVGKEFSKIYGDTYNTAFAQGMMVGNDARNAAMNATLSANKVADPDKMLKALSKKAEDYIGNWLKDKENLKRMAESARKAGVSTEQLQAYVTNQLQSQLGSTLESQMVRANMPKDSVSYIISGLNNTISGMIAKSLMTDSMRRVMSEAESESGKIHTGWLENLARETVTFAGDTPFFGISGTVSGNVVRKVAEMEVKNLMKRGITKEAAQQIIASKLRSSMAKRIGTRVAQGSLGGAVNLGTYNLMAEGARQASEHEFSAAELGKRTLSGALSGAVLGVGGGIVGGATANVTSKTGNFLARGAGFLTEAGIFSTTGEAEKYLEGYYDEIDPATGKKREVQLLDDFTHSAAQLMAMKLSSGHTLAHPVESFRNMFRPEIQGGVKFSDTEINHLKGLTQTKDLVSALSSMQPKEARFVKGDGKVETVDTSKGENEERQKRLIKAYDDFMNNKDVTFEEKQKVALVLGGAINTRMPMPAYHDIPVNEYGKWTVTTRDKDGNAIKRYEFQSEDEANMWMLRQGMLQMHNDAFLIAQDNPEAASLARQYMITQSGYTEEQINAVIPEKPLTTTEQADKSQAVDPATRDAILNDYYTAITGYAGMNDTYQPDFQARQGQRLTGGDRHNAYSDMLQKQNALSDGTPAGEAFKKTVMESEDPAGTLYNIAQTGTPEQVRKATDYYNAKAKAEGMLNKASGDIDSQVRRANENVDKSTNKETGNVITVTDSRDDKVYHILSGRYGYDPLTGRSLKDECDQSLVVRDAETGEIKVMSPMSLQCMSDLTPEELKRYNETELRDQLTEQMDSELTYAEGTPTEPVIGDTFQSRDGQLLTIAQDQQTGAVVAVDEKGQARQLDMDEYRDYKSSVIDSERAAAEAGQVAESQAAELSGTEPGTQHVSENDTSSDRMTEQLMQVSDQNGNVTAVKMGNGQEGYWYGGDDLNEEGGTFQFAWFDEDNQMHIDEMSTDDVLKGEDGKPLYTVTNVKEPEPAEEHHNPTPEEIVKAEAEAQQKAAEEAARKQAMTLAQQREEELAQGLVGYREGNPDIFNDKSTPEACAEYFIRQAEGDVDKAVMTVQSMQADEAVQAERQTEAVSREEKWQNLWGDTAEPEEVEQHEWAMRDAARMKAEAERHQVKLQKIYEAMMTPEAREEIRKSRAAEVKKQQGEGFKTAKTAYESNKDGKMTTGKDGKPLFSTAKSEEQDGFLANNYGAGELQYLADRKKDLKKEYETLEERQQGIYNMLQDYIDGTGDLTREAAEGLSREYGENEHRKKVIEDEVYAIAEMKKRADTRAELRRKEEEAKAELERQRNLTAEEKAQEQAQKEFDEWRNEQAAVISRQSQDRLNEIDSATTPEGRLKKAREIYSGTAGEQYLDDEQMEPQTLEEYVSNIGSHKIAWDDVERDGHKVRGLKTELGTKRSFGKSGDTTGINDFLAAKGQGMGIDELAHSLWENRPVQFSEASDVDIKEALLSVLASSQSAKETRQMILNNRIRQAEADARAESEHDLDGYAYEEAQKRGVQFSKKEPEESQTAEQSGTVAETAAEPETSHEELEEAKAETDTNPTEAQKEAGNYKKGHIKVGDMDVTVENPAGSERSGHDRNGKEWHQTMHYTYGYVRGVKGADGDHLDMFVNDAADLWNWNGTVFVIDQRNPDGSFDEHKVMYGFDNMNEAIEAYLSNYEKGWKGLGNITAVPLEDFKTWRDSSRVHTEPFATSLAGLTARVRQMDSQYEALRQMLDKSTDVSETLDINSQMLKLAADMKKMGLTVPKRSQEHQLSDEGLGAVIKARFASLGEDINMIADMAGANVGIVTPEEFVKIYNEQPGIKKSITKDDVYNGAKLADGTILISIDSDDITQNKVAKVRKAVLTAVFGHEMEHRLFDQDRTTLRQAWAPHVEKFLNRISKGRYDKVVKRRTELYREEIDDAIERQEKALGRAMTEEEKKNFEKGYINEELAGDITGEMMLDKDFVEDLVHAGKRGMGKTDALGIMRKAYRDFRRRFRRGMTAEEKQELREMQRLVTDAYRKAVVKEKEHREYMAAANKKRAEMERKELERRERLKSINEEYQALAANYIPEFNRGSETEDELRELFDEYVRNAAEAGVIPFLAPQMKYTGRVRIAAHKLKGEKLAWVNGKRKRIAISPEAQQQAIDEAAGEMSRLVPKDAVLIPMPSHTGKADDTLKLAEAISKLTGAPVIDILEGVERRSQYEAKLKGKPLSSEDMGMRMKEGMAIPEGKRIIFIDNVVAHGTTAKAAIKACGGGTVLAYTYSGNTKDNIMPLKSAELVTYGDDGKVIPLTERFNPEINDIRYSKLDIDKENSGETDKTGKKISSDEENSVPLHPEVQQWLTPERREASRKAHENDEKMKIKDLAYISDASRAGQVIPYDRLMKEPEIKAAQDKIDEQEKSGKTLKLEKKEIKAEAKKLLENYRSAVVHEDGTVTFDGDVEQGKQLFIVIGRPAGGKSSVFANPLSKRHHARIIDSDDAKKTLPGFDGGNGAGYVQNASAKVADAAMRIAMRNGDNIIMPRIGGGSVIDMAIEAKNKGYKVNLYYNDIPTENSIMRSAARFAETGRYLSLRYLLKIGDKPYRTLAKYYKLNIGEAKDARREEIYEQQLERAIKSGDVQAEQLLRQAREAEQDGTELAGRAGRTDRLGGTGRHNRQLLSSEDGQQLFDHIEWKNNNVPFKTEPIHVWDSESGEELPGPQLSKRELDEVERSDNFKRFFGDWEKDPENASKVVDEEGKPLVLAHGTPYYGFTVFNTDTNKHGETTMGSHFGSPEAAYDRLKGMGMRGDTTQEGVYNVFLNIRKPWECTDWFDMNDPYIFADMAKLVRENKDKPGVKYSWNMMKMLEPWTDEYTEGELEEAEFLNHGVEELESWDTEDMSSLYRYARNIIEAAGYDGIKYWNDVEGSGYSWVALHPEQIKSADTEGEMANNGNFDPTNPDIRFSKTDLKEDKTLAGVHNITMDKLVKALKLEGLANPSLAVIDTEKGGWVKYGEVSLVAPSSLIDKKTGRNIGTYDRDMWSPIYPKVQYFSTKQSDANIKNLVADIDDSELARKITYDINAYANGNSYGEGLGYLFLMNRGQAPDIVIKEPVKAVTREQLDAIIGKKEATYEDYLALPEEEKMRLHALVWQKGDETAAKSLMRMSKDNEAIRKRLTRDYKADTFNIIYNYSPSAKSNEVGKPDYDRTLEAATKQISDLGLQDEFNDYMRNIMSSLGFDEKIQIGWKTDGTRIYRANTLANVSAYMKKQGRAGSEDHFLNSGTILAKAGNKMNSLAAIIKNKDRLIGTSSEVSDLLSRIEDASRPFNNGTAFDFERETEALGYVEDIILGAPIDRVVDEYNQYHKQNPINLTDEERQKLEQVTRDAKNVRIEHFETKFERPVGLNEFKAAVVPDNTPDAVAEKLKQSGLDIYRYDHNSEDDRLKVQKEAFNSPDVLFSKRITKADPFYSNAAKALEDIKQEKATGEQWLAMLKKNGGLKAEEDKWMGLSDWLQGKKSVTKQEVADFMAENAVEIEDVKYSEDAVEGPWDIELSDDDEAEVRNEAVSNVLERYGIPNGLVEVDTDGDGADFHADIDDYPELASHIEGLEPFDPETDDIEDIAYDVDRLLARMSETYSEYYEDTKNARQESLFMEQDAHAIDSVRKDYQTRGLQNDKEIAMVVPTIYPYYASMPEVHFADNYTDGQTVAWVRFGDAKTADGKDALVLDEVQSQRHQDGRERGYESDWPKSDRYKYMQASEAMNNYRKEMQKKYGETFLEEDMTPEEKAKYEELYQNLKDTTGYTDSKSYNVPDAPFRKNWHELGMKRMLRYAAEHGYDKLAWTTGKQQADRYDLSVSVGEIHVQRLDNLPGGTPGEKSLILFDKNGELSNSMQFGTDGIIRNARRSDFDGKHISEVIGKELAEKALSSTEGMTKFKGLDLQLGGEGMKGFYDNMLVKFMNKYCKKWGTQVQDVELDLPRKADQVMHSVDITPEMTASVMEGQPMFSKRMKEKREEREEAKREDMEYSDSGTQFSKRTKPEPKNTLPVYKLMRLGDDGKLHALYIDGGAPIELGTWYDADSPSFDMLKDLPDGNHLIDLKTGKVIKSQTKDPGKKAIEEAEKNGQRWMNIVPATAKSSATRAEKQYGGQARQFYNWGINGSGGATTYALRPGWHAASLPVMDQIGATAMRNIRDDKFVWVKGEVSFDKDYQEEAESNPSGENDIPFHIPEDGAYIKGTSNMVTKGVTWYIAGSFKPMEIIGDREARKAVDDFNENKKDEDAPDMHYDWPRANGRIFDAKQMKLVEGNADEVAYWEKARDSKKQKDLVGGRNNHVQFSKRESRWQEGSPEYLNEERMEEIEDEALTNEERRYELEDKLNEINKQRDELYAKYEFDDRTDYPEEEKQRFDTLSSQAEDLAREQRDLKATHDRLMAEYRSLQRHNEISAAQQEEEKKFAEVHQKTQQNGPRQLSLFGDDGTFFAPNSTARTIKPEKKTKATARQTSMFDNPDFEQPQTMNEIKDAAPKPVREHKTVQYAKPKVDDKYTPVNEGGQGYETEEQAKERDITSTEEWKSEHLNVRGGENLGGRIFDRTWIRETPKIDDEGRAAMYIFRNRDLNLYRKNINKLTLDLGGRVGNATLRAFVTGVGLDDIKIPEGEDAEAAQRRGFRIRGTKPGAEVRGKVQNLEVAKSIGEKMANVLRQYRSELHKVRFAYFKDREGDIADYQGASLPFDRNIKEVNDAIKFYDAFAKGKKLDAYDHDGIQFSKREKKAQWDEAREEFDWLPEYEEETERKTSFDKMKPEERRRTGEDLYLGASRRMKQAIREEASQMNPYDTGRMAEAAIKVAEDIEKNGARNESEREYLDKAIGGEVRFSKRVPKKQDGESDTAYADRVSKWQAEQRREADYWKKTIINRIMTLVDDKNLTAMNRRRLKTLLNAVRNGVGSMGEQNLKKAEDIVREMNNKVMQRKIDELMKLKTQDVNGKNMSIAKNVDDNTRKIMEMMRGSMADLNQSAYDDDMTELRRRNLALDKSIKQLRLSIDRGDLSKYEEDNALKQIEAKEAEKKQNLEDLASLKEKKSDAEEAKLHGAQINVAEELKALEEKIDDYAAKVGQGEEGNDATIQSTLRKYTAMQILQMQQEVIGLRNRADELKKQRDQHDDNMAALADPGAVQPEDRINRDAQANEQLIRGIEEEINQKQTDIIRNLEELIGGGKGSLEAKVQAEADRKYDLIRHMFGDIGGKGGKDMRTMTQDDHKKQNKESWWKRLFTAQLGSFEYMAGRIARNSTAHDSWFYKNFVLGEDGVVAARNNYLMGLQDATNVMNAKCKEIYGKELPDVIKANSKKVDKTGIFTYVENGGMEVPVEQSMSKAQATYLYMVWKMRDGKARMLAMGYNDESMAQIREFIGDENADWADWVQDTFLSDLREKYNDKYIEMYNTSMANIEHYVPLRINGEEIKQESGLSDDQTRHKKLEERAGSLINRTHNTLAIDQTASAFDVVMSHVNQMEEWNAFARVRRDLDYILSNKQVRKQLNANTAGQWGDLIDAAAIATHVYHPEFTGVADKIMAKLTKGLAGGNIAWRFNTALKQTLSVPAFYGYSQDPKFLGILTKNIFGQYGRNLWPLVPTMGTFGVMGGKKSLDTVPKKMRVTMSKNFYWCMENMPGFRERVSRGSAGNYVLDDVSIGKLLDGYLEHGMVANQMIDAITCCIGAKSIYDYKYGKLKAQIEKQDLSPVAKKRALEEAHRTAINEADVYYNGTQQSNDAVFLSPMQMSRSAVDRAMSLYQNASIGYSRKFATSVEDLYRMRHWKDLKENLIAQGMTEAQATKHLSNQLRKSIFSALLYGFGLNMLWDLGGKGLLGLYAFSHHNSDDEDDQPWYVDAAQYIPTLAMRGQPGFNMASDFVNGQLESPILFYDLASEFKTDASKIIQDDGMFSTSMAGLVGNKILRMGGIDMKTWTNIYLAADDMIRQTKDMDYDRKNMMIDLMLFLNSPNSNRVSVAKTICQGQSDEEYAKNILRAMKYLEDTDEAWWTGGVSRLTGMKVMTKDQQMKIYKQLVKDQLTPEQLAKVKEDKEVKDILDEYDRQESLYQAYDEESDLKKKAKIGKAIEKFDSQKSLKNMSSADFMAEARKEYLGEGKKNTDPEDKPSSEYVKKSTHQDVVEDAAVREMMTKLKPTFDDYKKFVDKGDDASAETFYVTHKEAIDTYLEKKELVSQLNTLKRSMKLEPTAGNNLLEDIRSLRKQVLR